MIKDLTNTLLSNRLSDLPTIQTTGLSSGQATGQPFGPLSWQTNW
ncbi:MAG: hypothetical protein ABIK93_02580 [candidate division WOR-3 bacterium]